VWSGVLRLSRRGWRRRRSRHGRHVDQPGVRRQRPSDFIEDVRPHIPIAVHALNRGDLRQQRVADLLLLVLLVEEGLEPLVLGASLLEMRLQRAQLRRVGEPGVPQPAADPDPGHHGDEERRVLDLGAEGLRAGEHPGKRRTRALALEAGPEKARPIPMPINTA